MSLKMTLLPDVPSAHKPDSLSLARLSFITEVSVNIWNLLIPLKTHVLKNWTAMWCCWEAMETLSGEVMRS